MGTSNDGASGTADKSSASPDTAGAYPPGVLPFSDATYNAIEMLQSFGRASDPDFHSAGWGNTPNSVIIYRKSTKALDTTLESAYKEKAPGQALIFSPAMLTYDEVQKLNGLSGDLRPQFQKLGLRMGRRGQLDASSPYVISYSASPASTKTATSVPSPPLSLTRQFDLFGPGLVVFEPGEIVPLSLRDLDTPPF